MTREIAFRTGSSLAGISGARRVPRSSGDVSSIFVIFFVYLEPAIQLLTHFSPYIYIIYDINVTRLIKNDDLARSSGIILVA